MFRTGLLLMAGILPWFTATAANATGAAVTTTVFDTAWATIAAGKPLVLTARVLGAEGVPTGSVTFYDGKTLLGSVTLTAQELAELSVSTLAAGNHSLTASYGGDATFAGSVSATAAVRVTPEATTANTILVPSQQPTIQAAIDAAVTGDTVLVAPGTYKENLVFNGKAIVVTSESGPAKTIIDGGGVKAVVRFITREPRASVLNGFTLRNGSAKYSSDSPAGGIEIANSSPTVTGNILTGNDGCGVSIAYSAPFIEGNTISGTTGDSQCFAGYGVINLEGQPTSGMPEIIRNTIENNLVSGMPGISTWAVETALIQENIIRGNGGGGIDIVNDEGPMTAQHYDFENSTVTVDAATQTAYFASSYNLSGPNGIYFVSTRTFDVLGMLPGEDFGLYQSGGDHIIHYGSDGIAFRSSTASLLGTGKGSVDDGIYLAHTSLAKGN